MRVVWVTTANFMHLWQPKPEIIRGCIFRHPHIMISVCPRIRCFSLFRVETSMSKHSEFLAHMTIPARNNQGVHIQAWLPEYAPPCIMISVGPRASSCTFTWQQLQILGFVEEVNYVFVTEIRVVYRHKTLFCGDRRRFRGISASTLYERVSLYQARCSADPPTASGVGGSARCRGRGLLCHLHIF